METSKFDNFAEAAAFAKSLGQTGTANHLKRKGDSWIVEYEKSPANTQQLEISTQALLRKIEAQDFQIASLKQENSELKSTMHMLASNIHEQVATQTEKEKKALEAARTQLSEQILHMKAAKSELVAQRRKIESLEIDTRPLLRKIEAQDFQIASLKQENSELKSAMDMLASNIHEQVVTQTAEEKEALKAAKTQLSEEVLRMKAVESKFMAQKHKLDLLEKEYTAIFGEAEVRIVKERIISKEICPRCGGDGGVKGGCQKCNGSGWIDVTREDLKEVARVKRS